jgi:hypothetical protein
MCNSAIMNSVIAATLHNLGSHSLVQIIIEPQPNFLEEGVVQDRISVITERLHLHEQVPFTITSSELENTSFSANVPLKRRPSSEVMSTGNMVLVFGYLYWALEVLRFNSKPLHFSPSEDILLVCTLATYPPNFLVQNTKLNLMPRKTFVLTPSRLLAMRLIRTENGFRHVLRPAILQLVKSAFAKRNTYKIKDYGGLEYVAENEYLSDGLYSPRVGRKNFSPWDDNKEVFTLLELGRILNVTIWNCATPNNKCTSLSTKSLYHRMLAPSDSGKGFSQIVIISGLYEIKFLVPVTSSAAGWHALVNPIGLEVGLSTATGIFIMIFVFKVVLNWGDKSSETDIAKLDDTVKVMCIIMRPLLDESSSFIPSTRCSYRIAFAIWMLYCLLITSCYKGNLIRNLVTPRFDSGPTTFQQLVSSQKEYFTMAQRLAYRNDTDDFNDETLKNPATQLTQHNSSLCVIEHSNALLIFSREYEHIQKNEFNVMIQHLNNCLKAEMDYKVAYGRISYGNEAFVAERTPLELFAEIFQKVTDDRRLLVSQESVSNSLYLIFLNDIFCPSVHFFLRNIRDSGIFNEYMKGSDHIIRRSLRADITASIASKKPSLNSSSQTLQRMHEHGRVLRFVHMRFLFEMVFILNVVGLLCFLTEISFSS